MQVPVVRLLAAGQGHGAPGPDHVGRVLVESRLCVVNNSRVCIRPLLSLLPAVICSREAKTDSDDNNGKVNFNQKYIRVRSKITTPALEAKP